METLEIISRQLLINNTNRLVAKEREITAELIRHLCEIERRRLHLEMGFGSMFDLLTKHYKYSEGSADRRISAMRLSKDVPGVMQAIEAGKLSLSSASQVQHFLQNEQKQGKTYTPEQKSELAKTVEGKSRRETEKELLKISPASVLPKDGERQVTPTQTQIRFLADEGLMKKLEKLKALLAHHGNLGYAELIEKLADQALKKLDPEQGMGARRTASPPAVLPEETSPAPIDSVDVPAAPAKTPIAQQSQSTAQNKKPCARRLNVKAEDRRIIWKRAEGCCEYIDPRSGHRCSSRWALQVDHIVPLAKNGANELSNYRLACRSHNQWFAIRELGIKKMSQFLPNL